MSFDLDPFELNPEPPELNIEPIELDLEPPTIDLEALDPLRLGGSLDTVLWRLEKEIETMEKQPPDIRDDPQVKGRVSGLKIAWGFVKDEQNRGDGNGQS